MKEQKNIKTVGRNDDTEVLSRTSRYGDESVVMHGLKALDNRARMAVEFAEHWAMVAAELDGEDSAGRQKVRRLTPEELALHACSTVEAMYSQFKRRGWVIDTPGYEELFKEDVPADPE